MYLFVTIWCLFDTLLPANSVGEENSVVVYCIDQ